MINLDNLSDDELYDIGSALSETMYAAYCAAPNGEGISGGLEFATLEAVEVLRGKRPEVAIADAMGERGTYGKKRKYGLVLRPKNMQALRDHAVCLYYDSDEDRDSCVLALGPRLLR